MPWSLAGHIGSYSSEPGLNEMRTHPDGSHDCRINPTEALGWYLLKLDEKRFISAVSGPHCILQIDQPIVL